jgi:polysaccharide export outer membrane protein
MLRPVPTESVYRTAPRPAATEAPLQAAYVPTMRPGDVPAVDTSPGGGSRSSAAAAPPLPRPETLDVMPREKNGGKEPRKEQPQQQQQPQGTRTLPMPREPRMPEGYPRMPDPIVTNPPAAPREFEKRAYSSYIIEPPDVLEIILAPKGGASDPSFPIRGTHLVGQDGYIRLGPIGAVFVAGLTVEQAKLRIADAIVRARTEEKYYYERLKETLESLKVDIAAYNSKYYYVIADGGGFGEQVFRVLCTGNETVLDAIAQIEGLPRVASKSHIWVARATPREVHNPQILPVDWPAITRMGSAATNYQIYPGDRIYLDSDPLIKADSFLAKVISPIERLFGITLLGSTTVNSIKNGTNSGGTR